MSSFQAWTAYYAGQFNSFLKLEQRAIKHFQKAVEIDPGLYEAWRCLGFLAQQQGQTTTAIHALEQAISLQPSDAISLFNLGFILQAQHQLDDALKAFESCVRINPTIDRAWYGIGTIYNERREFARSEEALQEAARLQPFNPHAGHQLAIAYQGLGERGKLLAEYRRVKNFDPKMAEIMRREFLIPDASAITLPHQ